MGTCDAKIRPFPDDREVACEQDHHTDVTANHIGVLRDMAYPGSRTTLEWLDTDRRTYHGDWPGKCLRWTDCPLPAGHPGRCAT